MRNKFKSSLLGVLCATTALSALPPEALAGPMSVAPPQTVALASQTTEVHYYRRWGYRPYYRHWGYRPHYYRWGYYRPMGYYRPYYRRVYYGYPRYYGGYYDPAGAMFAGAALGLMGAGIAAATAPRWGGWGYGGWGGPGWGYGGWGGGWGPGWGGGWW